MTPRLIASLARPTHKHTFCQTNTPPAIPDLGGGTHDDKLHDLVKKLNSSTSRTGENGPPFPAINLPAPRCRGKSVQREFRWIKIPPARRQARRRSSSPVAKRRQAFAQVSTPAVAAQCARPPQTYTKASFISFANLFAASIALDPARSALPKPCSFTRPPVPDANERRLNTRYGGVILPERKQTRSFSLLRVCGPTLPTADFYISHGWPPRHEPPPPPHDHAFARVPAVLSGFFRQRSSKDARPPRGGPTTQTRIRSRRAWAFTSYAPKPMAARDRGICLPGRPGCSP